MTDVAPPSERQLSYLRALAGRTATTFVTPHTRREASLEIDRLRRLPAGEPEMPRGTRQGHDPPRYATALRDDEVTGFGSSTTWRSRPAPSPRLRAAAGPVDRAELARYRVSAGERILYGTSSQGRVSVRDEAADGSGPDYPVETITRAEATQALPALLADYVARARELDDVPMAPSALAQLLAVEQNRV